MGIWVYDRFDSDGLLVDGDNALVVCADSEVEAAQIDLTPFEWTPVIGLWTCRGVSDGEEEAPAFSG